MVAFSYGEEVTEECKIDIFKLHDWYIKVHRLAAKFFLPS